MRFLKVTFVIIFFILLIILLVSLFGFQIFIKSKGKDLITNNLSEILKQQVTVEDVKPEFPFKIKIKNFEIKNILNSEQIFIKFQVKDILNLLKAKFSCSTILFVKPVINLEKKFFADFFLIGKPESQSLQSNQNLPTATDKQQKFVFPKIIPFRSFLIYELLVSDGVIYFSDNSEQEGEFKIKIEDVDLNIQNLNFSKSGIGKFNFKLTAKSAWQNNNFGKLNFSGWLDYSAKNMDAKLILENIDYSAFSFYYPPFWKPNNLGIKEAYLSLVSYITAKDNDLLIDNVLSLDNIVFLENFSDQSKIKYIKTILALMQVGQQNPTVYFRLRTKLDSPTLDFSNLKYSFKGFAKLSPSLVVEKTIDKTKQKTLESIKRIKELTFDNAIKLISDWTKKLKDFIESSFKGKPKTEIKTNIDFEVRQQNLTTNF